MTAKFIVPAIVLGLGVMITTVPSAAKPEYAKKEKTGCVTCHTKMGSKELNDVGKNYKETGKLQKK